MTDEAHYLIFGTVVQSAGGPIFQADRGGQFPLTLLSVSEIRPVTDDVMDLFEGAEFWFRVSVGSVTDEESLSAGMLPTGINVGDLDTASE